MRVESEWSDGQWAEYLGTSSDPDDRSLCARLRIVEYLNAKEQLDQSEQSWLVRLQAVNKRELEFLKRASRYRIRHERPCWPRWHWSSELEELYHRTIGHGQQGW